MRGAPFRALDEEIRFTGLWYKSMNRWMEALIGGLSGLKGSSMWW